MSEIGEPSDSDDCKAAKPEARAIPEQNLMHSTRVSQRIRNALAVIALIFGVPAVANAADETSAPARCSAAEYRQFDFWIGEWDTFEMGGSVGPSIARAEIRPLVDGCALHERYEQSDGLVGDSILSFDPVRRQWQQTWVTNRGSIMVLRGGVRDAALVLEGEVHLHDGTTVLQRITWSREGDAVRETAVLSRDGGASWQPAFDVLFRRR